MNKVPFNLETLKSHGSIFRLLDLNNMLNWCKFLYPDLPYGPSELIQIPKQDLCHTIVMNELLSLLEFRRKVDLIRMNFHEYSKPWFLYDCISMLNGKIIFND